MSQEKIREVLNAVDCIYEPKMLIELIRWQQGELNEAKKRGDYYFELCRLDVARHQAEGRRHVEMIVHLENALSGSPDLT